MIHQQRLSIETALVPPQDEVGDYHLDLIWMKLCGKGTTFLQYEMEWFTWATRASPWYFDWILACMPIDIDPLILVDQASESAAIIELNNTIDLARLRAQFNLHLAHDADLYNSQFAAPTDDIDNDDIRTEFEAFSAMKVFASQHNVVPIRNATGDLGIETFISKGGFMNVQPRSGKKNGYTFTKPSVLALWSRQLLTSVNLKGPWDAAGLGECSEAEWKYIMNKKWRRADDDVNLSGLTAEIPFVIPRADRFESDGSKLLNMVGLAKIHTATQHPQAQRVV